MGASGMIAIVGAGVAGVSAAEGLRGLGYEGTIQIFCGEKTLPYERPALSKGFLVEPELVEPPTLRPPGHLAALNLNIELLGCEVTTIDPLRQTIETESGEVARYDRLLLATGAEPRRLMLPGVDLAGIHYLRDVEDARRLRCAIASSSHVAIIGGGVIGLEVAAAARQLGIAATVIEATSHVMGRVVPSEFAETLEELHRERGVVIRTGISPVGFEGSSGRVGAVSLADGSSVRADCFVVGIGSVPRTELAASAGLRVENGILVDEQLRSSDERIFAAGDAAAVFHCREARHVRVEQWRPAEEQGHHVAACILGAEDAFSGIPWMWSDQHDLHLQASGFGFADAEVVRRGSIEERTGVTYLGVRDGCLVAACGVSVGTGIGRSSRIAHMLIESQVPVEVEQIADPSFDLRRIAVSMTGS